MVILIAGTSHTGKTLLAQKILERYHYPYLSIDHLKMGLIRSGQTELTPCDDDKLTDYLWPILREIIKTVIENGQNLVVEGCYIPFNWADSFEASYRNEIRYCCLVMTEQYIHDNFENIRSEANAIEKRLDDSGLSKEWLIADNRKNLAGCVSYNLPRILIDSVYDPEKRIGGIVWPM